MVRIDRGVRRADGDACVRKGVRGGPREEREGDHQRQIYAWAHERRSSVRERRAELRPRLPCGRLALSRERRVPIAGKDFKTGQTPMKTVLAPTGARARARASMLKARMLGLRGWFSTNILGNRDGEVLDDPGSFHSKEVSKLGVIERILERDLHPELYREIFHKVRIEYYPPRGDAKEGWDNIDIFGWLGYPMQVKNDFLCRDSILAAPLVLDLAPLLDPAQRAGMHGTQVA